MANVDLSKAKKVREAVSPKTTNELLEKGWTLISVANGKDEEGYPLTTYSLAWLKDGTPIEPAL